MGEHRILFGLMQAEDAIGLEHASHVLSENPQAGHVFGMRMVVDTKR